MRIVWFGYSSSIFSTRCFISETVPWMQLRTFWGKSPLLFFKSSIAFRNLITGILLWICSSAIQVWRFGTLGFACLNYNLLLNEIEDFLKVYECDILSTTIALDMAIVLYLLGLLVCFLSCRGVGWCGSSSFSNGSPSKPVCWARR